MNLAQSLEVGAATFCLEQNLMQGHGLGSAQDKSSWTYYLKTVGIDQQAGQSSKGNQSAIRLVFRFEFPVNIKWCHFNICSLSEYSIYS